MESPGISALCGGARGTIFPHRVMVELPRLLSASVGSSDTFLTELIGAHWWINSLAESLYFHLGFLIETSADNLDPGQP